MLEKVDAATMTKLFTATCHTSTSISSHTIWNQVFHVFRDDLHHVSGVSGNKARKFADLIHAKPFPGEIGSYGGQVKNFNHSSDTNQFKSIQSISRPPKQRNARNCKNCRESRFTFQILLQGSSQLLEIKSFWKFCTSPFLWNEGYSTPLSFLLPVCLIVQ